VRNTVLFITLALFGLFMSPSSVYADEIDDLELAEAKAWVERESARITYENVVDDELRVSLHTYYLQADADYVVAAEATSKERARLRAARQPKTYMERLEAEVRVAEAEYDRLFKRYHDQNPMPSEQLYEDFWSAVYELKDARAWLEHEERRIREAPCRAARSNELLGFPTTYRASVCGY